MTRPERQPARTRPDGYEGLFTEIRNLLSQARRQAARSVNAVMTATYWEVGRRIVQFQQGGKARAAYGEEILERLAKDLTSRFGRGFGVSHIRTMRQFFLTYPRPAIRQSVIGELAGPGKRQSPIGESPLRLKSKTPSQKLNFNEFTRAFPLSWTHYARLIRVQNSYARKFYEAEALRGGWSVPQLNRQIGSQFYERTALSRNKAAMLTTRARSLPSDAVTPEAELKDPYVLEFLNLKDEYSESELEEALIRHLESFLLELGGDFAFIARQRRLRVGSQWYRVDLVFFHRRLRCLVLIDLKLTALTHADAGQMHLYLNYAREHWTNPGENPPVGLILCAEKDSAVAHYALEGLANKVLASEYKTKLPKERELERELDRTRHTLIERKAGRR